MRIEHAEHGVADLGKVVVELQADAGVEVGERLDQPLDVRVFDRVGTKPQPAGDLRMRLGELGAETADEGQLAIVIGEQFVAHHAVPFTSTVPVAGSNDESNTTGSGAGSAYIIASMRNRMV